jgi:iron complex outermembrane recepter protein
MRMEAGVFGRTGMRRCARLLRSGQYGLAAITILIGSMPATSFADVTATPSTDAASSSGLEEIVVTARRRDESLQNVPESVAYLSEKDLTAHAIADVFSLNKAVPGLTVQANNGTTALPAFSIRGRGQNYGAATGSVETYFAEVPLSPPFQEVQLPPQFFDLSSVQVLKGPQGTLFGRNTTGGAVVIVPAAPTDQLEGYSRVQFGDYNDRQFEGAANIPLSGDDRVDLRVAAFYWSRDGYMKTVGGQVDPLTGNTLPSQDYENQNMSEVRATLRLRPTANLENSLILTYHYDKVRTSLSPGLQIGPPGTFVTNEALSGLPVYEAPYFGTRYSETRVDLNKPGNTAFAVINTTKYTINDGLVLKNIFGYINALGYNTTGQDFDGTTAQTYDLPVPPHRNANYQYTNEVQLQGVNFDRRLTWTTGALVDLTREPDGTKMNYQDYSAAFGAYSTLFENNDFTSYSGYFSVIYKLTDQLNLSVGYRHTWDDITESFDGNTATPDPAVGLLAYSNPANTVTYHKDFSGNTYNIGLDWHPTQDLMVYGGYRRGYKRGGFSSSTGNPFDSETVNSYSLGLKQDFTLHGMRGRYSIEGFYDHYYGLQNGYTVFDLATGNFEGAVANIPRSTFRGVETEGAIDLTNWLTLRGSFSYIDAFNTQWTDNTAPSVGTQDLTVNPVPYVSKYKGSVTARFHTIVSGLGDEIAVAPTVNAQSVFYTSPFAARLPYATQEVVGLIYGAPLIDFNQISVGSATVPGYTTFDARMEWNHVQGTRLSLAANVINLTNKYYLLYNQYNLDIAWAARTPAPPRMWFVEARYEF